MLTLLTFGFVAAPVSAQNESNVLIVADGSSTNEYVPIYGLYMDEAQHNQIIYPESMLGDMVSGEISEMKFHLQNNPYTTLSSTITVSLGTTTTETFTSGLLNDVTLTQVYTGAINISNQEFTITFSTPFTYNGGNLLFDLSSVAGNYASTTFLGVSSQGSSYCYNNLRNFIPKTTFTYTGGALCKTPYDVNSPIVTTNTATISWHGDENASSYNVQYMLSTETEWDDDDVTTTTDTTFTLSNLLASTSYKVRVQTNCDDNTQTSWSNVITFTTECGDITITDSWTEDFEGYTGSGEQHFVCWSTPVTYSTPISYLEPTSYTFPQVYCGWSASCHSGSNSAEFKGPSNMLVLPRFTNDLNTLRLTFWATADPHPGTGSVEVGVITNLADPTSFELVGVCSTPGPRGDY